MAQQPAPQPSQQGMADPQPAAQQAVTPQVPDTMSATAPPPKSDGGGYTSLISPKDFRVYRVPANKVQAYRDYGYVESKGSQLNEKQVQSNFDYWRDAGGDFLVSTVGNAPFVRTAVGKLGTPEQAKWLSDDLDAYAKEHPILDTGAKMLGTGLALAGAAAVAAPAAAAAGIGGVGAGAAGLLGAGTGAAATTLTGGIAAAAGTNVALGAIARFDDAALHHAFEPAGQEKIAWSITDEAKNVLLDAALGAAIPGVVGGAGKALGWLGKNMSSQAQKTLRAGLLKERAVTAAIKQGRGSDITARIDEVMTNAPKTAPDYIKAQVLKTEVEMNTIKRTLGPKAYLAQQAKDGLRYDILNLAGGSDQINSRISKWFKNDSNLDLHNLQQMNKDISKWIGWSDYDVNKAVNDKYSLIRNRVIGAQQELLQAHDASFGGTTSSQWNDSLKRYSDWVLLDGAISKRATAPNLGAVLRNVAANAAGGFVLGTAMSGGDITGGFATAATGAGYGVIKGVRPAHYAMMMQKLGGLFSTLEKKASTTVMHGLYGLPAQLHARHYDDPAKLSAVLSAVNSDPPKVMTNLRNHSIASGIPDVQADDAAMRHFTMLTDVAATQPKRSAGADLPTKSLGDPMQLRKAQALMAVAHDPTVALANPTKTNIAFLSKHFPNLLFSAQQACLQQLQQNPDLPYASKQYCAKLLGRPVSNSTSPNFSSMIQQARQQMAQSEQQAAQGGPKPPKAVQSGDSPSANTRLDGLQGGG